MESKPGFRPNPQLKLMDQVKEVLRYYHYAYRTEETYCQWILRYIHFYGGKTQPRELGGEHIERVTALYHQDLQQGFGEVYLPNALQKKYPNAARGNRMAICLSVEKKIR